MYLPLKQLKRDDGRRALCTKHARASHSLDVHLVCETHR